MFKRFFDWNRNQSSIVQLILTYCLYVLGLMAINIFLDKLWPDDDKSFYEYFVKALRGAIIWTLLFDFSKVAAVFKKTGHARN